MPRWRRRVKLSTMYRTQYHRKSYRIIYSNRYPYSLL
jgi:hypothetical protein